VSRSAEATRLLALELYREGKVSLGSAAELCHLPIERFMEFSCRHNVPLHSCNQYGVPVSRRSRFAAKARQAFALIPIARRSS
jgi:hypothetical protein